MAVSLTHAAVVAVADDGTSPVGSNEWNAQHTLTASASVLLGTAGAGAVGEVPITAGGKAFINSTAAVDDLSDVVITAVSDGQVLTWDSATSKWVNEAGGGGSTAPIVLGTDLVEQRNGINDQTFRVYNTYTDAANYERGVFDWSTTANTLTIGTQAAGTGIIREWRFGRHDIGGSLIKSTTQGGNSAIGVGITGSGETRTVIGPVGTSIGSDMLFGWSGSVADGSSAFTAGLARSAAGVVEVNNGTAGTAAALKVATLRRNPPVTKTADFSVADTDSYIICNKGSAGVVTLPAAASYTGREISFTNIQAFAWTSASSNVVPRAGGSAGNAILPATDGAWCKLVSDGTNWINLQGTP